MAAHMMMPPQFAVGPSSRMLNGVGREDRQRDFHMVDQRTMAATDALSIETLAGNRATRQRVAAG